MSKTSKWPITSAGINRLLDHLTEHARLKNDAALSRKLELAPPVISKLRHDRLPLGASLIIRMHEAFDISIADIKALATWAPA
jgi:plasmid maintenance system antidote protein VapI